MRPAIELHRYATCCCILVPAIMSRLPVRLHATNAGVNYRLAKTCTFPAIEAES